jgi:hypothetical protein
MCIKYTNIYNIQRPSKIYPNYLGIFSLITNHLATLDSNPRRAVLEAEAMTKNF